MKAIPSLLVRRLISTVPLLLSVGFVTFFIVRLSGQDPVSMLAGPVATEEEIAAIRRALLLDQPIASQFLQYLKHAVTGDLGQSWVSGRPVMADLIDRIPATLELLVLGGGLGVLAGVWLGLRAGIKAGRPFDQFFRIVSVLGISIPTYWLGLVMLFFFFFVLGWAPPGMGRISVMITPPQTVTGSILIDALIAGNWEAAWSASAQLVLPVICFAIITASPILKQTRAIVFNIAKSDFVVYGAAQGLPPQDMRRMVLRSSMPSISTFIGAEAISLIGTLALIEYVFAWGGVGQYGLNAIIAGDFAAVQGYVLFLALFSMVVFLVVDVLVAAIDPRI